MDQSTRTIAKNIGALLMSQVTTWSLTLALSIFLPRYLGPSQIGQYYLALSIWAITVVLAKFGTEVYNTKEIARHPEQMPQLIGTSLVARTVLFTFGAIAVAFYTSLLDYSPSLKIVVAVIGLAGYFQLIALTFANGFAGREQMGIISISTVAFKLVYTALAFLMIFLKTEVFWVAVTYASGTFVEMLILSIAYMRRYTIVWTTNPLVMARLLRLSAPYLMASLVVVVYNEIDKQIIAALIDEEAVGFYTTAATLFSTVMFIPVVFTTAIFPKMARAYTNTPDSLPAINRKSFDIMFLLGIPVGFGIMAIAPKLIILIYGESFAMAGPILALMGVVVVFVYQNILISQILASSDKIHWWTAVLVVSTIITVFLDILLVPWCQRMFNNGALAGAISYLLTEAGQTMFGIFLLAKGTLRWSNVRVATSSLAAGMVMLGACWLVQDFFVLVPVILGAITYVGIILALRVIPKEDMELLKQLATQAFGRLRAGRSQVSTS